MITNLFHPPSQVSLLIFNHTGAQIIPLAEGKPIVIGREPPVDVLIRDAALSRRHVLFELLDNQIWVEDLQSTNGTWINGKRVSRRKILPGMEVLIGGITVNAHILGASERPLGPINTHDQFLSILEEEISYARKAQKNVSILNAHFPQGKRIDISHWIQQIQELLRPNDSLALYCPDSLEILMPDLGPEEALNSAKAIVAQSSQEKQSWLIGLATFPDSASSAEELIQVSRNALKQATVMDPIQCAATKSIRLLASATHPQTLSTGGVMIKSRIMQEIWATVERLAQTNIPVLIQGETGTGKELIARGLHEKGKRQHKSLCCINCGAIPEQLVESILFGHERGAFTGADKETKGIFEEADGGTVFLDELGELPVAVQSTLLRVIDNKKVIRVGSTKERDLDVRIIAATNQDLEAMCNDGTFRWDLFFRINAIVLKLPPLRERTEEIPLLVEYFIAQVNEANECQICDIEDSALHLLHAYPWPGNIRELRNVIERAVVLAKGNKITIEDLPERICFYANNQHPYTSLNPQPSDMFPPSHTVPIIQPLPTILRERMTNHQQEKTDFKTRIQQFEIQLIADALETTKGNQTEAAKQLGIPLRTLVRKIKTYSLKIPKGS